MMRSSFGFEPTGKIFDTMLAGQLSGMQSLGLAAMLEKYFDVAISKVGQRWDWSQRPLATEKIRYAVCDTHYLPELAQILTDRLDNLGRLGWHGETCERMKKAALQYKEPADTDMIWRINGQGISIHLH
jgi:ribonuclease D